VTGGSEAQGSLAHLAAAALLEAPGTLIVSRPRDGALEPLLCIAAAGEILAFCGHVDLGTGLRTALAQIVAEELDVGAGRVTMVLGDTARVPNQGATIASDSIQNAAQPLRKAAAQARAELLGLAARVLGVEAAQLRVFDGRVAPVQADARTQTDGGTNFGALIGAARLRLNLDMAFPVKPVSEYRLVGTPQPRVDIPAKASGAPVFVHDVRVDGMLHGSVVRPPYIGVDHGPFVGTSLIGIERESIAHLEGIVDVVVEADFIGIVAQREDQALAAADALKVHWKPVPQLRELEDLAAALSANPATERRLQDRGDVEAALQDAAHRMPRRYVWPYQLHASIGPSCAVADVKDGRARIWSGTQNPHELRNDIARLLGMPAPQVDIIRLEVAGCYGRNCADDVCADAALLSRAVGRPVRVQLTRAQEHQWEPKGTAQLMEVDGGLDSKGEPHAYHFETSYPSNTAPTLALLLTGRLPPLAQVIEMGDRTSVTPYACPNARVTIHDMAPIVRASWLRGVSAMPNVFAHESWIDEAAAAAGVDPVEYRLRYLEDPRGQDLVRQTAAHAEWQPHAAWGSLGADGDVLHGRGFAYALYKHGKFPGTQAAWSAWVADVDVNRVTGEVLVARVTTGHDAGLMINPAGVRHQIHGNVIQSISRTMRESVSFARGMPTAREWGSYPIIRFTELPQIDTLMVARPDEPSLGAGESASVPSAAAIANAIYDACGVRFREPPFTPERVREGLEAAAKLAAPSPAVMAQAVPTRAAPQPVQRRKPMRWGLSHVFSGASLSVAALLAAVFPWRSAIAPIAKPDPSVYSAATIDRGRQLAALGDCAVCHTAEGGITNAGGRPLETPFGTVYATNITPDPDTGLGGWSYVAFERAMRDGIHRDGRHLYPAFPYTHFTHINETDLQALYAYLMAQEPVRQPAPRTQLKFPFSLRPLMGFWNALFLEREALSEDAARSPAWNRGRYLVEGLGHCAACHSPRNALGAEAGGRQHLAGGWVDGWEAPPLTRLSQSPIPWDKDALVVYLRTGYSALHGSASGPMGPVITQLQILPDEDIDAMAVYLSSFNAALAAAEREALVARIEAQSLVRPPGVLGAELYEGACAVCHLGQRDDVFGIGSSLAFNTNLHSTRADNLVRVIMEGVATDRAGVHGAMPSFAKHFDDRQLTELVMYLRKRFAPDQPAWADIAETVARVQAAR
jgi:nicotinate dehydrogenase subunit B